MIEATLGRNGELTVGVEPRMELAGIDPIGNGPNQNKVQLLL